jgi:hypothetical protein
MNKKTLSWNVKQTVSMIDKGTLTFDHPCQRPAGQWQTEKESLLIDSILRMFIPPIYAIQIVNGDQKTYSVIDGKQRLSAIHRFLNDQFALSELEPITLESGGNFELSGKLFSELEQEVQEEIKGFTLSFCIIEIEENEDEENIIEEIFYRLNNGSPVSKEHLTLISTDQNIQNFVNETIKNHSLFTSVSHFSEGQRKKSDPQMAILQTIMILSGSEFESMAAKHIREFFKDTEVRQELFDDVNKYFTIISDCFDNKYTKFIQKIHISSLSYLIKNNMNKIEKVKDFILWYSENNKKGDDYRRFCGAGNVKKDITLKRLDGIQKEFDNWSKNYK